MTVDTRTLADEEAEGIRDAITEAVLATPPGLRDSLEDDPQAYLRLVASTRVAADQTSKLLREAIDGARAAGHSWDTIGRLLGVSRQAAQQRFGNNLGAVDDLSMPGRPARKMLTPLTAFDEMLVLEREGRRGWHSIDYGTLYHLVEASPWQWQHRRIMWGSPSRKRLQDEGWQLIKTSTFPWGYYKRRVDLPAEPE
ncbi:MAG TPA: hypothetical protein VIP75_08005 [Acidothermales bacterium]